MTEILIRLPIDVTDYTRRSHLRTALSFLDNVRDVASVQIVEGPRPLLAGGSTDAEILSIEEGKWSAELRDLAKEHLADFMAAYRAGLAGDGEKSPLPPQPQPQPQPEPEPEPPLKPEPEGEEPEPMAQPEPEPEPVVEFKSDRVMGRFSSIGVLMHPMERRRVTPLVRTGVDPTSMEKEISLEGDASAMAAFRRQGATTSTTRTAWPAPARRRSTATSCWPRRPRDAGAGGRARHGVMAYSIAFDYEDEAGEVHESLLGPYPDPTTAERAFRHVFPTDDPRVGRPRLLQVEEIRPLPGYDQRRL